MADDELKKASNWFRVCIPNGGHTFGASDECEHCGAKKGGRNIIELAREIREKRCGECSNCVEKRELIRGYGDVDPSSHPCLRSDNG